MNGLAARAKSFWRGLRSPERLESEMDEEMRFHREMEAERIIRERGLTPDEARRQAAIAFGGAERFKEEGRDARGLTRITGISLDLKLGLRMVARHPGLTVVSVAAMAFGIAVGAGSLELVKDQLFPPLPYAQPERIVLLRNVSTRTTQPEPRALHDFAAWRGRLRSVENLSALALRERTLALAEGGGAPVSEAAVSASAFALVGRAPLLGRPLLSADEAPGAPPVSVLGHTVWRDQFAADPGVVGRVVRLGGEPVTVVGVMPEHFAFLLPQDGLDLPPAQDLWVPFRQSPLDHAPGEGPAIEVFGQLAPGATLDAARAELATWGASAAGEWPATHARLKPQVLTFARSLTSGDGLLATGVLSLSALFLAALMAILCANVALLVFARAAAREGEMAVRSALGASRGRIVAQLFAEALVLAAIATSAGLLGAWIGLGWVLRVMASMLRAEGVALPSWVGDTLSPSTVAYALVLAVAGAAVAGVLPGLKVTGRRPQTSLQRMAGRGSGTQLGSLWTGIIIAQVTLTTAFVPIAVVFGLQSWKLRVSESALPPAALLSVQLVDGEAGLAVQKEDAGRARVLARFEAEYRALERRLEAEPGVAGVALASHVPGSPHPSPGMEVDGLALAADGSGDQAQLASVDPDFFAVMGAAVLAGRPFAAAEAGEGGRAVVVNESFVRELLGGRNAVGRRVRLKKAPGTEEPGPWLEIVGVIRDLPLTIDPTLPHNAGIYLPLRPGEAYPARMVVRTPGDAAAFAGRLRELATEEAPGLRVRRALPLAQAAQGMLITYDAWFRAVLVAGAMALLLTGAGIYAILSFTVARRTREIGVRVALGADRRRVITALLSRTARQVGAGVVVGALLGVPAVLGMSEGSLQPTPLQGGVVLVAYMALMMGICMLACVVPARRALRIEPMEALSSEG